MSWNQPPNGQAGMMQRPPMQYPPQMSNNMPMGPPPTSGPPTGLPPTNHPRPPQFNASRGDQLMQGYAPPNMHNGPPPRGPPIMSGPPKPGQLNSPQISRPPMSMNAPSTPTELLPAPYHGKGIYSHTTHVGPPLAQSTTPTNSEPSSLNTSRVPSPIPNQHFDALEGQFRTGTPNSNLGTPPSGSPVPQATPSPRGIHHRPSFPQPNYMNGPQPGLLPPTSQPNFAMGPPAPAQQPQPGLSSPPVVGHTGLPPHNRLPPPGPAMPTNFHNQGAPNMGFPPRPPPQGQYPPPPQPGPPQPGLPPQLGPPQPGIAQPGLPQPGPPQPGLPQPGPPQLGLAQPGQPQPGLAQPGLPQPGLVSRGPPPFGQPAPVMPPGPPLPGSQNSMHGLNNQFGGMGLQQQHHQVPLEMRTFNLLQERNILPAEAVTPPVPNLPEHLRKNNCSPDIFRCTLNAMPQSNNLLQKSRLPLGILIHPFKDLSHLPVIQSSVIVRCRACRTYINPFVSFIDQRRWRCNLCFRANELPEEFNFDPVSRSYGSPERRPEIKSATIEFVAPSEYMLRPPQPCVYLFLLDVSYNALQNGYLQSFCEVLSDELDKLPGDSRTMVGFITYNSSVHFYNLSEDLSTPQIHVVSDVDDIFLPLPDGLLANLQACRPLIDQLLQQLPTYHQDEFMRDDSSAMGSALQAALKLLTPTGGRVSIFQTSLPNVGPGKLQNREDPNQRASSKPANLQPATDFYKQLSLEAAGQQIALDMFLLNHQYADHATIGGAARHSGGGIYAYPGLHNIHNTAEVERFEIDFRRYLVRKIGLEAVMRVRCTKGLAIHTFHGNFFVRSTDLLSLPNINPDAGFGMQVSIEENLTDSPYACLQAALLYTSSKGERRIRVHTMCVPVTTSLTEVIQGADQQAIICILSKMAVDRSINSAVSDAREALVNACVDALSAYGTTLSAQQRMGTLPAPYSLRLLPLYVSAMLKHASLRLGVSTKTDERVQAMDQCKTLPLSRSMQELVPDLYPVHALNDEGGIDKEEYVVPQPPRLALCSGSLDRHGMFLLDVGAYLYMWVGAAVSPEFCAQVFDVPDFASIKDGLCELPELENEVSERLRIFVSHIQESRPGCPPLVVVREDSRNRHLFIQHMIEDKTDSMMSYYEFLQHIQKEMKT